MCVGHKAGWKGPVNPWGWSTI